MAGLERVKRRIKNATELQTVVKTMKAIASANILQYEESMRSINQYDKTIELGLQIALGDNKKIMESRIEDERKGLGAVIFGSEQGLCGKFNEVVVRYAMDRMAEIGSKSEGLWQLVSVFARLEEAGETVEAHFSFLAISWV